MMAEENNERISELETEIAALKKALAAQSEALESRSVVDFAKIKKVIDDGTKNMIDAVKPVVQKCSEPGKAAAEKVGVKVSENPIISVIAAFGVGIVIGKLLELSLSDNEK
jgi:ElaB/YqjD/DUF883 family membrane-anchored ribosome-binding protein